MASKRVVLVEFVGLPGSGKTTTAKAAVPMLESHGLRVRMNSENIMGWADVARALAKEGKGSAGPGPLAGLVRHPWAHLWMIAFACSIRPLRKKNLSYAMLIVGWLRRTAELPRLSAGTSEVLMQDEGAYHLMTRMAMFGESYSPALLKRAARSVAGWPGRLVVFVQADSAATVVKRQAVRQGIPEGGTFKTPRSDTSTFEEVVALREDHQRSIDTVMEAVSSIGGDRVLKLDTASVGVEMNAQRVVERIIRERGQGGGKQSGGGSPGT